MTQADAQTGIEADRTLSFEALRERMIAELIGSGVLTDPAIEAAFRAVPREVFAQPALRPSCRTRSTTSSRRGSVRTAGSCLRCPHR